MTHDQKTGRKISTDRESTSSSDSVEAPHETVKNELSENELQDINGGCCTGQHMPVV